MAIPVLEVESVRRLAVPISVEQYHSLTAVPFKTELIHGVIIEKMPKSPLHTFVLNKLHRLLIESLRKDLLVRKEDPLTTQDSEPEPDIAVIEGSDEKYRKAHPGTALLVIEVAMTSLDLDRKKADIYAAANIPEYWILIPEKRTAEVYSRPINGVYADQKTFSEKDTLHFQNFTITLATLLN